MVDREVVEMDSKSHRCWDSIECFLLGFSPVLFQVEVEVSVVSFCTASECGKSKSVCFIF